MENTTPTATRKTLSVEEAAAILGMSRAKAYDCARSGELPSLRFGRRIVIPAAALEQMLAGHSAWPLPKTSEARVDAAAS